MICQPDFTGVRIKIERAKHHFYDLQARCERFKEGDPYRAVSYDEPDTGDLVYRVEVSEQPPLSWSAIVGDCVHNLRSSLDLLVCEMVRANDRPVTPDTAFYIAKSADAFRSGYNKKIKGTPQPAVDLIKEAKPYEGGDNPFWQLHRLDIEDKHKLLVPVGSAHLGTVYQYNLAQILTAYPDETTIDFAGMSARNISVMMPLQPFPLKDGSEICRFPARLREDPRAQLYMNPEFEFEIAFGEVEVVEGKPLISTLHRLIEFVEGFVELFPPLFGYETLS